MTIINKEKNFISAVVYIHDNENQIEEFLNTIYKVLNENFEKFEIIFVNDGCIDGTLEKIKQFKVQNTNLIITIINMSLYQGIELSMNAGVDLSLGDFVFEFDSVLLDYKENLIIDVYNHCLKGYDIVSACPKTISSFSSKLFYIVFNKFFNSKHNLRTERFRILSRRAINRVYSLSKIISYRKVAYINSGLSIGQITYDSSVKVNSFNENIRQTRRDIAFDSFILFTDIAYKASISLTCILFASTLFCIFYTIFVYLGHKKPIEGWTTIMFLLSSGFAGIFLILAIIIKYLSVLVELVLKKQKYLVESVQNLTY